MENKTEEIDLSPKEGKTVRHGSENELTYSQLCELVKKLQAEVEVLKELSNQQHSTS